MGTFNISSTGNFLFVKFLSDTFTSKKGFHAIIHYGNPTHLNRYHDKNIIHIIFLDNCATISNGNDVFCNCNLLCSQNEGDCDSHDDCQDGLACGSNNCPASLSLDFEVDCCYQSSVGHENFCTIANPCGGNEGHCDSHDECHENHFCGYKNCPDYLGFASYTDCCYNATHLENGCMYSFVHKQRIVGGVSAESPIPWQVAVVTKKTEGYSLCGGSILDDKTILSAAHCFEKHDSPSYIRAGSLYYNQSGQVGSPT